MLLAIGQLDDPAFLGAVLRSVAWPLAALAVLGGWTVLSLALMFGAGSPTLAGWAAWLAGFVGLAGAVALMLGLLLFVPLATAIATLFVDRVAGAVERRHYPGLPPGVPASVVAQAWGGVALGLLVLAMQMLALVAAVLLPGLNLVAPVLGLAAMVHVLPGAMAGAPAGLSRRPPAC